MRATVLLKVVDQLFGELEPRTANIRLSAVEIVGVCGAAGGIDSAGDNTEDAVGHPWTIRRLSASVVVEISGRIRVGVVEEVVDKDHVRLFDLYTAVHRSVLEYDTCIVINRNVDEG